MNAGFAFASAAAPAGGPAADAVAARRTEAIDGLDGGPQIGLVNPTPLAPPPPLEVTASYDGARLPATGKSLFNTVFSRAPPPAPAVSAFSSIRPPRCALQNEPPAPGRAPLCYQA